VAPPGCEKAAAGVASAAVSTLEASTGGDCSQLAIILLISGFLKPMVIRPRINNVVVSISVTGLSL